VVICGYVHLVERRVGAGVLFSQHCHNITMMGRKVVSLCYIMYIF
jgi:hypothetical protein